jgi:hypothetical protein
VVCAAIVSGLVTAAAVRAAATRLPRVVRRRALLETCDHVELGCASPAEIAYLLRVERAYGLPRGERQVVVPVPGGRSRRVDVRYGRVVVEIDGGHHRRQRAADEARDVVLHALGYRVLRVSASDVWREPGLVAATVAAALAANARWCSVS